MALQGNYNHKYFDTADTETINVQVEYPTTLESNDPNYPKRGTSENTSFNQAKQKTQSFTNAYIVILSTSLNPKLIEDVKKYNLAIEYAVYSSKSQKDTNIESYDFSDTVLFFDIDTLEDKNSFTLGYEKLKTLDQFSNLLDV